MTLQLNYVSQIVPSHATLAFGGATTTGKATNGIGRFERDGKSLVNATRRVLRTAAVK